jgi:hypothetical protein
MGLGDQLVQVNAALLEDVARSLLPPAHLIVSVTHSFEPLLGVHQLVDTVVHQFTQKRDVRGSVNPHLFHRTLLLENCRVLFKVRSAVSKFKNKVQSF